MKNVNFGNTWPDFIIEQYFLGKIIENGNYSAKQILINFGSSSKAVESVDVTSEVIPEEQTQQPEVVEETQSATRSKRNSSNGASGKIGDNLTWTVDEKEETMTISGTGALSREGIDDAPEFFEALKNEEKRRGQ